MKSRRVHLSLLVPIVCPSSGTVKLQGGVAQGTESARLLVNSSLAPRGPRAPWRLASSVSHARPRDGWQFGAGLARAPSGGEKSAGFDHWSSRALGVLVRRPQLSVRWEARAPVTLDAGLIKSRVLLLVALH